MSVCDDVHSIVSFQAAQGAHEAAVAEADAKEAQARELILAHTALGNLSVVWSRALVEPGASMGRGAYLEAGYAPREVDDLFAAYRTPFALYDDTYHFMTKRYIFEEVSYVLKWIFPLFLLIVCGAYLFFRSKALKHD